MGMEFDYEQRMKMIRRFEEEKWERHRETDKRENLISQYEKENGELTSDQLEKIRKMYNNYIAEGKEFKIEYIDIILNYDKKVKNRRENCKHEDMFCGVEKRGCEGCYYENEEDER